MTKNGFVMDYSIRLLPCFPPTRQYIEYQPIEERGTWMNILFAKN